MADDFYDDYTTRRREQYAASADAEVWHFITRYIVPLILTIAAVGTLVWYWS